MPLICNNSAKNDMRRKKKLSPISLLITAIALTIVAMAGTLGNYAQAETATVGGSAPAVDAAGDISSIQPAQASSAPCSAIQASKAATALSSKRSLI